MIHLDFNIKENDNDSKSLHDDSDINTIASPTSSMWDESRRSSFSSVSSDTIKRRSYSPGNRSSVKVNHAKSLPAISHSTAENEKYTYTTQKAAQERIDFLENHVALLQEQLDKKNSPIKAYQTAIQKMSSHIDNFFISRKTPIITMSDTRTKLHQLKEIIDNQGHTTDLLNFVQNWMTGIDSPNTVQENVPRQKNERLIEALQKLSKQNTELKKKLKLLPKLEKKISNLNDTIDTMSKQHNKDISELKHALKESKEESSEVEQLLDDVRREMEIMLEEMDQVKQEREQHANSAKRLKEELEHIAQSRGDGDHEMEALEALLRESEAQLDEFEQVYNEQLAQIEKLREESRKSIDTQRTMQREATRRTAIHESEVSALHLEKEELRKRLIASEKAVADLQKKAKAIPQHDTDLELALRRTVAERDGQLAKLNVVLEKKERQIEQIGSGVEQRIQKELETRHSELVYELENRYKKESDAFKLSITRETRALSCQVGELESELELKERQELEQQKLFIKAKLDKATAEEELKTQTEFWAKKELELRESIFTLEQKIESMEKEVLVMYSKNLEMAQQLGELDP